MPGATWRDVHLRRARTARSATRAAPRRLRRGAPARGGILPGGWCATTCTSSTSATCGSNSSGEPNYCVENAANAFICFPGCTTDNDCDSLQRTRSCMQIATGGTQSICSAPSTSDGFIGDPCNSDSDCKAPGATCAGNWCSQSCASATDTSCGMNSESLTNYCVQDGNEPRLRVLPGMRKRHRLHTVFRRDMRHDGDRVAGRSARSRRAGSALPSGKPSLVAEIDRRCGRSRAPAGRRSVRDGHARLRPLVGGRSA